MSLKSNRRPTGDHREGVLLGLGGLGLLAIALFCLSLTLGAVVIGLIVINEADLAPGTTASSPTPTDTVRPTATLLSPSATHPRSTVTPETTDTPVTIATSTPVPATPASSPTSRPTTSTPAPTTRAAPQPSATATSAPSSPGVNAAFLADARQTRDDLMTIKVWFDRLAGGESIACDTVYAHAIHRPASTAPSRDPNLAPTWNEYQAAIRDGQRCLQWLVDFCDAGGGTIDEATFWDRRELSSSALSRCEHVVQTLEGQ